MITTRYNTLVQTEFRPFYLWCVYMWVYYTRSDDFLPTVLTFLERPVIRTIVTGEFRSHRRGAGRFTSATSPSRDAVMIYVSLGDF